MVVIKNLDKEQKSQKRKEVITKKNNKMIKEEIGVWNNSNVKR